MFAQLAPQYGKRLSAQHFSLGESILRIDHIRQRLDCICGFDVLRPEPALSLPAGRSEKRLGFPKSALVLQVGA
jgi:hypothetical protein